MSPFPIQEMTLPVALSGSDVIGQAKTGTGKTLGFGLPLLERVTVPADVEAGRAAPEKLTDAPQALIVVPTRELCQQVTNDLLTAGKVRNVRVLAIYGGRAYEPQVEALKKGVDVVVGTPGRLLDLAGQRKLDLSHVRVLVLDEADEMLDLGFLPDVERIITMLPAEAPDDAVLGHHARCRHQPRPPLHVAADAHQRHVARRRGHDRQEHGPARLPRPLHGQAGDGLAHPAGRGPRAGDDLLPYEADGRRHRGAAGEARLRVRRGPRRPRPGRPRAGAARLPQRQGRRPRLHRRRRTRHRRRGCDARHQLPVAGGREDLPPPHRPYRPRGRQGHRRSRWSTGTTSRAGS